MTDQDNRFQFWFRVYINDVNILNNYVNAPETFPHIDPAELAWEMQNAWQHLEELIPADHLQAIHDLL